MTNSIFAEIITIGDEILYGQITDTNTQWISAELDKIGIKTIRKTSVGDDKAQILAAFADAEKRADIVLITGGLGPTKDDITKKTICQYFDDHLVLNDHAFAFVKNFFDSRGREFTEINQQQALLPSKAVYLFNKTGTAPGMWIPKNAQVFVSMPGVPHEMKYLMSAEVIPRIKEQFNMPVIVHQMIRTVGIGESLLAETIEDWEDALPDYIKLAYLPSFGQVKLRLTAIGNDEHQLQTAIDLEVDKLKPLIDKFIYSYTNEDIEVALGRLLKENNATISVAESCTGGYLSHLFTKIPGSSAYFLGSVVAYANATKTNLLGVSSELIEQNGAVSEATAKAMAEGARAALGSTYGLATTGVAGPDGGSAEKPVGTIWVAVTDGKATVARKLQLFNQRDVNIPYGANVALNLLRKFIQNDYQD